MITDVCFKFDGKEYWAERVTENTWMWTFAGGHERVNRGETIPVPLTVQDEFNRLFPRQTIRNESARG